MNSDKDTVSDTIDLSSLVSDAGEVREMPPEQQARYKMTGFVLIALFILVCGAAILLVCAPEERLLQANEFFDFIKAGVPPLVTLILGYWFHASKN